jgi:hypothetical protein
MKSHHKEKATQSCARKGAYENHPHAQPLNGSVQGDLYTAQHNSEEIPHPRISYDERAKHPNPHGPGSQGRVSSHKKHIAHLGDGKPFQPSESEIASLPLMKGYHWFVASCGWLILYKDDIDTSIQIRPLHTGSYLVAAMDKDLIDLPSLRQALALAQNLSIAFKDSLPRGKRRVNLNRTEPFF